MRILPAIVALGLAFSTAAAAAPCHDSKGKFITCAPKPAAAQKCRDAKGKFVKCSASSATAVTGSAAH